MIIGGILPVRLVGQYGVIGDGVGARAVHRTDEQAGEARLLLQNILMLVIHIKKVEMPLSTGKTALDVGEQLAQDRRTKGIEEEGHAGALRKGELGRVGTMKTHGRARPARLAPKGQILASNPGQGGIKLHTDDLSKGVFRSEEHASPHSRPKIDKRIFVERSDLGTPPPSADQSAEKRRGDAVIGGIVPVMTMPTAQKSPWNKSAGSNPILEIERMALESLFDGKAWQETPPTLLDIWNRKPL